MGRFSESQKVTQELGNTRVGKNLTTKKEPMVTRSIRMPERDIKYLKTFFKKKREHSPRV